MRVDVTVVDRHGEPVTTLTADDFAVEEDGVPQTVQSFKFVSADGQPPPGDDVSLPIRSPEHAAAEAARDEVRVFVIFWDEYHIGRFADAIKGRKALTDFVSTAFGPADLVALMDPLLPVDALRFTRDRRELAEKIGKLEGRFGIYTPTRSAAEDNMLQRRDIARVRSEVTISALQSAAVHLGSIKEGRKSIIFVSEGLTGLGLDQLPLIRELTETANNNNTAIYTLDPAGLTGGSSDILRTIAENTGAEAFVNTNTPEKALRQVVREASAFYLLGYSSSRNPQDGKFHKIGVKVKRSGIDVRARRGYWAPNATEIERARTELAAAAAIPADVTSAMAVLSAARADRLVDVWAGAGARRGRSGGGDGGVDAAGGSRPRRSDADRVALGQRRGRRSRVRREASRPAPFRSRRRRARCSCSSPFATPAATSSTRIGERSACPICRRRRSRSARRSCCGRARSPTRVRSRRGVRRRRSQAASSAGPIVCLSGSRCTERRHPPPRCRRGSRRRRGRRCWSWPSRRCPAPMRRTKSMCRSRRLRAATT